MLLQRSANKETAKLKPLFVSDEQSTSSNLRPPYKDMKKHCKPCSRATEMQQMNVSCYGIRTLCLSESFLKKVGTCHIDGDVR